MDSKKAIILLVVVFALSVPVMLLSQPSGAITAAVSSGFMQLLGLKFELFAVVLVGLWAVIVGGEALLILPLAFILVYAISAFMLLDASQYTLIHFFILGALLIHTLAIMMVDSRKFALSIVICCSVGFHMGRLAFVHMPEAADPMFYLIGQFAALIFLMAIVVSFGLPTIEYVLNALKEANQRNGLLSAFRIFF